MTKKELYRLHTVCSMYEKHIKYSEDLTELKEKLITMIVAIEMEKEHRPANLYSGE